jgi:hypothetical protein
LEPVNSIGVLFPGGLTIELYGAQGGALLYTSSDFGGSGLGNFGGVVSDVEFSYVVLRDWFDNQVFLDDLATGIRLIPEVAGTVRFRNPDGTGLAPIRQAYVELLHQGSVIASATTRGGDGADAGEYSFSLPSVEAGNHRVRASLKQPPDLGQGIGGFEVKYMPPLSADPVPYVETADFQFGLKAVTRNLRFEQGYLDTGGSTNLSAADRPWLEGLATIYFHVQQAEQFAIDQLSLRDLGYVEVRAWDDEATSYAPAESLIFIHRDDAPIESENRPENREWHEYFHHVMGETVLTSAPSASCGNHQGFLNTTTTDSWQEGWALFWAEALGQHLGKGLVGWYADVYHLDTNYQPWDHHQGSDGAVIQREGLAVASVLWDLYDLEAGDKADLDADHLSRSLAQMTELLLQETAPGTYAQLATWQDVYDRVLASGLPANEVNEIWEAHGFFGDHDWIVTACNISGEGNRQWESEEALGEGGRQGRPDLPPVSGANLLVHLQNEQGLPVGSGPVIVNYHYPEPYHPLNASIERTAVDGNLLHLEPPPARIPMTLEVRGTSSQSGIYSATNSVYWDQVAASGLDHVAEFTFTLRVNYSYLPVVLRH